MKRGNEKDVSNHNLALQFYSFSCLCRAVLIRTYARSVEPRYPHILERVIEIISYRTIYVVLVKKRFFVTYFHFISMYSWRVIRNTSTPLKKLASQLHFRGRFGP